MCDNTTVILNFLSSFLFFLQGPPPPPGSPHYAHFAGYGGFKGYAFGAPFSNPLSPGAAGQRGPQVREAAPLSNLMLTVVVILTLVEGSRQFRLMIFHVCITNCIPNMLYNSLGLYRSSPYTTKLQTTFFFLEFTAVYSSFDHGHGP